MFRSSLRVAIVIAALSLPTFPSFAGISTENGWQNAPVTGAPAFSFTGGMDALPNGNVVIFNGTSIVEVDPSDGSVVNTLFTPAGFVFGSFVRVDPTGAYLLFGESTNHDIYKVPLNGAPATVVANIPFNFSCAFHAPDIAFVSRADATFTNTLIERFDVNVGATDLIATLTGPSGPIAFDRNGNLYYGENSSSFPAPVGQQDILLFLESDLLGAIGPSSLSNIDAFTFSSGVTAPFDFAFDEKGDLFVSDSGEASIREFDHSGVLKNAVGTEQGVRAGDSPTISHLAIIGNGAAFKSRMGAFQPDHGGTLMALSSTFDSLFNVVFNDLNVITPKRAYFEVSPASPVPVGPVDLTLRKGPAAGMMILFFAGQAISPELVVPSSNVPLYFGIDFGTVGIVTAVPLDGAGEFLTSGVHAGGGGSGIVQGVLFDASGTLVGTSEALAIQLQ